MIEGLLARLRDGGDQICYQDGAQALTYAECYERVCTLSQALRRQGTGPVAVYGHKCAMQFVSILACVAAQRCYIPLDTHMPRKRIEEILAQAGAELVLANAPLDVPGVACFSPEALAQAYPEEAAVYPMENEYAYIIFTSGSTGKSKGVPISYENLSHFIAWITQAEELAAFHGARVLSVSRFSFDLSVMDIYFSLFTGGTIVAVSYEIRDNLQRFYDELRDDQVALMVMTPTLAKLLLLEENFSREFFTDLRGFFFCGECLEASTARRLHERFPEAVVINAYGPTECTCCVTLVNISAEMEREEPLPVGIVSRAAVDVLLEDDEIVLRGGSVFGGYLGMAPDDCRNAPNSFHTKDIGALDGDLLYCRGRKDHQVKYEGYRIELGDIEQNLLQIDGVREAVVCAKRKSGTGVVRLLKAFVVASTSDLDEKAIKSALAKRLPAYMIPKTIILMDALPVNANGKYDRKKLEML